MLTREDKFVEVFGHKPVDEKGALLLSFKFRL